MFRTMTAQDTFLVKAIQKNPTRCKCLNAANAFVTKCGSHLLEIRWMFGLYASKHKQLIDDIMGLAKFFDFEIAKIRKSFTLLANVIVIRSCRAFEASCRAVMGRGLFIGTSRRSVIKSCSAFETSCKAVMKSCRAVEISRRLQIKP